MNKKGFTLIELLVVIAIIGILATIVLASLNTARNKANDVAVKSNMANIRAQAELFYDGNNNSYSGICTNANVTNMLNAAKNAAGVTNAIVTAIGTAGAASTITCHDTSAGWGAESPLKTSGYQCVDSTGVATTTAASTLAANDVACN